MRFDIGSSLCKLVATPLLMKKLLSWILFSVVFGVAQAAPQTPEPALTVQFGNETLPAFAASQLISPREAALPEYPQMELQRSTGGRAVLTILVEADGTVSAVDVASSIPAPAFGAAARAAALKWKYVPLQRQGQATRFVVQQAVIFDSSVSRNDWSFQNEQALSSQRSRPPATPSLSPLPAPVLSR